jgi:hypothetical protein
VTITLGRSLVYIAGVTVAAGLAFLGWQALRPGSGDSFHDTASDICREHLPAIASAPDFQAALARSRDMRSRLSELTPPEAGQEVFAAWLAALKGAEDAALRGDLPGVQAHDASVRHNVMALGLEDACIHRLS